MTWTLTQPSFEAADVEEPQSPGITGLSSLLTEVAASIQHVSCKIVRLKKLYIPLFPHI